MNIKDIFSDKALPLGVIIIIITYLVSGASSNILPYVFITSILVGIMKHNTPLESAVVGLVTTAIVSCGLYFIMYGATYLTYALSSIIFVFPFYIILGAIGGAIGYYCAKELKLTE